jgi:hypothetical protein
MQGGFTVRDGRNDKPAWWLLYVVGLLLVGGLTLVEVSVPAGGARTVLECFVVVSAFGLMSLWRRRNRAALDLARGRRDT